MYIFSAPLESDGHRFDALVIFSGQYEGDEYDYGFLIEKGLHDYPVSPDVILFIYPGYLQKLIGDYFKAGRRINANLNRYKEKPAVLCCSFFGTGRLRVEMKSGVIDKNFSVNDHIQRQIIQQGIFRLAEKRRDSVILTAPPGTFFVKPSKSKFDEFIKASELSVGYSENLFIAFCLLFNKPDIRELKSIYVDTSGISAYVEALIYYIHKLEGASCRPVRYFSFGSYERKSDSRPDDTSSTWVIISASASNNLGEKICRDWRLSHDQVTTILSYTDSVEGRKGDIILSNISRLSKSRTNIDKFGSEIAVKVVGENFTAQISEPNAVILKAAHRPNSIKDLVQPFVNSGIFVCNKKKSAVSRPKPIYMDFLKFCDASSGLDPWLAKILAWHTPRNVKWVIYEKTDPAAVRLRSKLDEHLQGVQLIDVAYHEAEIQVKGPDAAIVLAPVVGSGRSLLQLNRNMRMSGHDGNRLFLAPVVVTGTEAQFSRMKQTLIYGPGSLKYSFFNLYQIFVGPEEKSNSWECELRIVENLDTPFWQARGSVLANQSQGINGAVGVPPAPSMERLGFTNHFAFWSSEYDSATVDHEAVFLTICAVLQRLREKPFTEYDNDSLRSQVYQHSVIDPENFTRLNDPLLQSCLWRAAKGAELNYESAVNLAHIFENVMVRLIQGYGRGEANAALDILMGIACGKIRTTSASIKKILEKAEAELRHNVDAIALIDYMKKDLL